MSLAALDPLFQVLLAAFPILLPVFLTARPTDRPIDPPIAINHLPFALFELFYNGLMDTHVFLKFLIFLLHKLQLNG